MESSSLRVHVLRAFWLWRICWLATVLGSPAAGIAAASGHYKWRKRVACGILSALATLDVALLTTLNAVSITG